MWGIEGREINSSFPERGITASVINTEAAAPHLTPLPPPLLFLFLGKEG